MKVTLRQAREIISAHNDLIGALYIMPDGTEMLIHEFRLLTNTTEKGQEINYSIIVLLKDTGNNNSVQFYASFESIIAQVEARFNENEY